MSPQEIRKEHRQSTKTVRRDHDDDFVVSSPDIERKDYERKVLTRVVSAGERHILRRPL